MKHCQGQQLQQGLFPVHQGFVAEEANTLDPYSSPWKNFTTIKSGD
jgi:hypothetical protein